MNIQYLSEPAILQIKPCKMAALISITAPNHEAPLTDPDQWGALLRIRFSDAEYDENTFAYFAAKGEPYDPAKRGFPCRKDAETIQQFLAVVAANSSISKLFVHCHAGQRRSAAVAKYASELYGAAFDHSYDGYNRTVYRLLQQPDRYDHLMPKPSWIKRFLPFI